MLKMIFTAAAAAGSLALSAAAVEWNFTQPEKWTFPAGLKVEELKEGTLVTVPEKPAWGKPPKIYQIKELSTRIKAGMEQISFTAELISGSGATVGLVLTDAKGESFAYPQLPIKAGAKKLSWNLTKPAGSWGKNKDGKIDYPAYVNGFMLHQYPVTHPAQILFRNTKAAPSAASAQEFKPVTFRFAAPEKWDFGKNIKMEKLPYGLKASVTEPVKWGQKVKSFSLFERSGAQLKPVDNKIAFYVELLDGGGISFGMDIRDAKGESFALPQKGVKKGLNYLEFDLAKPAGSWGKNKDGKIDFPITLDRVVYFQYPAGKNGTLLFRNPEAKLEKGMVTTLEKFYTFGDAAKWDLRTPGFDRLDDKESLTLQLKPEKKSTKPVFGRLWSRDLDLTKIGSPYAIELDVELLEGSGANVGMVIMDSHGEHFAAREKGVKKGKNTLVFTIPEDLGKGWGPRKNNRIDGDIKLMQLYLVQYPNNPSAKVRFTELRKRELKKDVEAVSFSYETGLVLPVLKVGCEKDFALKLTNNSNETVSFSADLKLVHADGKEQKLSRKFVLPAFGSANWPMEWTKEHLRGVWRADLTFTSADKLRVARSTRTSFIYMQPAGPNDYLNSEFVVGVNIRQTHFSYADQDKLAQLASLIGCKLLRSGHGWETVEPVPGKFDFTLYDRLRDLNEKYNMQFMQLVAYTPKHAVRDPKLLKSKDWNDWNKSAPDADKLEKYTYELVKHNGDKVIWYEFWNEPDLDFWRSDVKTYIECMERVYRALKKANPKAQLISGGLAAEDHAHSKPGFNRAVAKDGQKFYDWFGYHQHGDYNTYRRTIDGPVAGYVKMTDPRKPVFFTETGFYTSNGNEPSQAEAVLRKIVYARAYGARGYLWFDLRNDGYEPGYCEHNYGLTTFDYFPKVGLASFNTLCLMLDKAFFSKTLIDTNRTCVFSFKRHDGRVLAVWKAGIHGVEESIAFLTDAKSARLVDWQGNSKPLKIHNGRLTFTVPARPGFVELPGATKDPQPTQAILALTTESIAAVPGRPFALKLAVSNPTGKPAELNVKWIGLPANAKAQNLTQTVPAGKSTVTMPFTVAENAKPPLHLGLDYTLGADSGTLSFPVNLARLVPAEFPAEPQFVMADKNSVVSQVENNPYTEHRVWKSAADKSGKVYLACDGKELRIKLNVTDDKLVRSQQVSRSYIQDGVQFALSIPGQNGHWEFGCAVEESGKAASCCWINPAGKEPFAPEVTAQVNGGNVEFFIRLPYEKLGLTPALIRQGIQFNLIVNDNDGEGRDGWIQIAPGIGEGKTPELYPFIVKR